MTYGWAKNFKVPSQGIKSHTLSVRQHFLMILLFLQKLKTFFHMRFILLLSYPLSVPDATYLGEYLLVASNRHGASADAAVLLRAPAAGGEELKSGLTSAGAGLLRAKGWVERDFFLKKREEIRAYLRHRTMSNEIEWARVELKDCTIRIKSPFAVCVKAFLENTFGRTALWE